MIFPGVGEVWTLTYFTCGGGLIVWIVVLLSIFLFGCFFVMDIHKS